MTTAQFHWLAAPVFQKNLDLMVKNLLGVDLLIEPLEIRIVSHMLAELIPQSSFTKENHLENPICPFFVLFRSRKKHCANYIGRIVVLVLLLDFSCSNESIYIDSLILLTRCQNNRKIFTDKPDSISDSTPIIGISEKAPISFFVTPFLFTKLLSLCLV